MAIKRIHHRCKNDHKNDVTYLHGNLLVKLSRKTYLTFVKVNIGFIVSLVKEELEIHDFL